MHHVVSANTPWSRYALPVIDVSADRGNMRKQREHEKGYPYEVYNFHVVTRVTVSLTCFHSRGRVSRQLPSVTKVGLELFPQRHRSTPPTSHHSQRQEYQQIPSLSRPFFSGRSLLRPSRLHISLRVFFLNNNTPHAPPRI
jgi:hypothetical protein